MKWTNKLTKDHLLLFRIPQFNLDQVHYNEAGDTSVWSLLVVLYPIGLLSTAKFRLATF